MLDKNKSNLTHRITAGASTYLSDRGFKPIETEVKVAKHWLSDIAGVVEPTMTEMQQMKLVPKKPIVKSFYSGAPKSFFDKYGNQYWQNNDYKNSDAYKKYKIKVAGHQKKYKDWLDLVETLPALLTAVIEVKVSRGDFTRDVKWDKTSPVNLRYLAVPCGMLKRNEYPVGWWILECDASGKVQRLAQEGTLETVKIEQQLSVIHNIAVRRHHRTEYKWLRDMSKQFNANETKIKQNMRTSNIVKAIIAVTQSGGRTGGNNAKECFKVHDVDWNVLQEPVKEEINSLWGISKYKKHKDKR